VLDAAGFVDFGRFCLARNLAAPDVAILQSRFCVDPVCGSGVLVSAAVRALATKRLIDALARFHATYPQVLGPRREQALAFMGREFAGPAARACFEQAMRDALIILDGACVRLPAHRPHLAEEDQRVWDRVGTILRQADLRPPHVGALAEALDLSYRDMNAALVRFETFGLLVRVARNRFFLPETIDKFRGLVQELAGESDGNGFTAADFNRKSAIGRNLTIELLEYLDRSGATKRRGLRRLPV